MTILIFLTKFTQERYFHSKTEKVSTTNEFFIFELIYNPGHNILNKIEKSSKIDQGKKSLIPTFV